MDRRNTRWSERCYECRCKLGPGPWTQRPIPRLGGAERDVCFDCAGAIDGQQTIVEDAARAVSQVDRAVETRNRALARTSPVFRPPADVADLAEDYGHPLAQSVRPAA